MDETQISTMVENMIGIQRELEQEEAELMQDERFKSFLARQKEVSETISKFWKNVETTMIDNGIRSVKGDWGSLTIATRTDYKVDEEQLPKKYYKRVVDTAKIRKATDLFGEPPKGAEPVSKQYLTKRIK